MFIRVLMLEGTGLSPSSSISIAVAALILGKAVLLADMVPLINRFPNEPLIYNIAWKTVNLLADSCSHSLSGASNRFLAGDGQLCLRAIESCWRKSSGRISGDPDHSVRTHRHVLHDARIGPGDRQGKGAADILRPDACAGSVNPSMSLRKIADFTPRSRNRSETRMIINKILLIPKLHVGHPLLPRAFTMNSRNP